MQKMLIRGLHPAPYLMDGLPVLMAITEGGGMVASEPIVADQVEQISARLWAAIAAAEDTAPPTELLTAASA